MRTAHVSPSLGKLPPQAPEIEQAVIGACLLVPGTLGELSGILEPTHFYVQAHALLWHIMLELHHEGLPVDLLTVTERAKASGYLETIGGAFYISQLTNKVSSSANAELHARLIQQKFIQRRLIELGQHLQDIDESEDVFDTLDTANNLLAQVNAIPSTKDPRNAAEVLAQMVDNRDRPLFITLGMGDLDRHVRMGPKNVVVVGARPSVGKTTFALNACMNIARSGHKVLFISLEMSETDLGAKIASALTGIDSERITFGDINEEERTRIAEVMAYNGTWIPRILIEDLSSLKSSQITGIIQRAATRHGVEVVVLDYLQCVTGEGDSPVDRMTNISRACKTAAKSTGVRLIELSQLKRRDGAEEDPQMSDLREAGQIEADGDIIIMLGRAQGATTLRCNVPKNKVGPIGTVEIPFDLQSQRIGSSISQSAPAFPSATQFPTTKRDDDDAPF